MVLWEINFIFMHICFLLFYPSIKRTCPLLRHSINVLVLGEKIEHFPSVFYNPCSPAMFMPKVWLWGLELEAGGRGVGIGWVMDGYSTAKSMAISIIFRGEYSNSALESLREATFVFHL